MFESFFAAPCVSFAGAKLGVISAERVLVMEDDPLGVSTADDVAVILGVISAEPVLIIDGDKLTVRDTLKVLWALQVVLWVADAVMATVLNVVGILVAPSELLPFAELDEVMLAVLESEVVGLLVDVTVAV
jgi:hypothetical protein